MHAIFSAEDIFSCSFLVQDLFSLVKDLLKFYFGICPISTSK